MDKKYSTLIILIIFAIILNFTVLGILAFQPNTETSDTPTPLNKPISKVIVSVIPTNLPPPNATIPLPASSNTDISNSSTNNEKLTITNLQTNFTAGSFTFLISNYEQSQVAITNVFLNDRPADLEKAVVIPANSKVKLLLTLTDGILFARTYQIKVLSSEGQSAIFYAIAY